MVLLLSVTKKHSVDAGIQPCIDNLLVVWNVGTPPGGVVTQQVVSLALLKEAPLGNSRGRPGKINAQLAGVTALQLHHHCCRRECYGRTREPSSYGHGCR